MDPAVFGVTWQEEAAANQAACVESAATIFASVFSTDGAQLITGALSSQRRPHPIHSGLGVTLFMHPNCSLRRFDPPCRRFKHGAHSGHGCQYDDTGERTRVTARLRLAGLPACDMAASKPFANR